mgnify:CR=1 FL=1
MRKTISKTNKGRLWLTALAAIMIVAAIAVVSVAVFTERSAPDQTAGATALSSWNVASGGTYELTTNITVPAAVRSNDLNNITIDGQGHTITINGSGDNNIGTFSSGASVYRGILFGKVSNLTLKNVKIVYNAQVSFQAYNNASRPDKMGTDAAGRSSILYAGIIAGGLSNATFDNVTLQISSGAKFAAFGMDNGNNGSETCGPGQGTAVGFIAGSAQGNLSITGLAFTNNGLIHARGESWGANQTYNIRDGLFSNNVRPALNDGDRVVAAAGGLFGVVGTYGNTTSASVRFDKLEVLGNGAVGSHMQDGNVKFDYAGGLIGDIRGGNSVELNNLYYYATVQVYGNLSGNVRILVGAGAQNARLNGIWVNFNDSTVTNSRYNSGSGINGGNNIGSISKPSNIGGTTLTGIGYIGIDNRSSQRSYNTSVTYEGSKTLAGYSKNITGFARSTVPNDYGAMTNYMNLKITMGNTANVILSYVRKGELSDLSNRREYYSSRYNATSIDVNNFIPVTCDIVGSNADIEVVFADTYNVSYNDMSISDNANGEVTYSGTSPGISHSLTIKAADLNDVSWEQSYMWRSEHFFINSDGGYAGEFLYTYTDEDGIQREDTADGNLSYDTTSLPGSQTLSTSTHAGIYRVSLVKTTVGSGGEYVTAADGELVAKTVSLTSFYYFDSSDSCLEYKILRRRLQISAINNIPPIEKEYDGTKNVYSENIIAGQHYQASIIDDNGIPGNVYTGDDRRIGLKITSGGFTSASVGDDNSISITFVIDDISDYVQVDQNGTPTSSPMTLSDIPGNITRRNLLIEYGDDQGITDVTYTGEFVHPEIRGFYVNNEVINQSLKEEIDALFAPGNFIVETFSDYNLMNAYYKACTEAYGKGGTDLPVNTNDRPVNANESGYYVMVVLTPEAYNNSNFALSNSQGGRYDIFTIVPREVEVDWAAMAEQLEKTYSGQSNTFTVTPIWKGVDGIAESGVTQIDKDYAESNKTNALGYIVEYTSEDEMNTNTKGVTNAGIYTVTVRLSGESTALGRPDIIGNYSLVGETQNQITVNKANISVVYSVSGLNDGQPLVGENTPIVYNALYDQLSIGDINGRNDLDIKKLVSVRFGSNPDGINTVSSGTTGQNAVEINQTYTLEGGNYTYLWNVGRYTLTIDWGSKFQNAIRGGANYNLVNATHTFEITPLSIEYGDISDLSFEYDRNSHVPTAPSDNTNYYDNIRFVSRYFYYDENADGFKGAEITQTANINQAGKYVLEYSLNSGGSGSSGANVSNYVDNPRQYVFEITPYDISANSAGYFEIVLYYPNQQYRGQNDEVTLTYISDYVVNFRNNRLNMGDDFTVSYDNNINISTDTNPAKLIVTAVENGNFTGETSIGFNITKRTLSMQIYYKTDTGEEIEVDNRETVTHVYDGTDVFGEKNRFRIVLYYIMTDEEGTEVRVTLPVEEAAPVIKYEDNITSAINVGEYTISADYTEPEGNQNYEPSSKPECTLEILKREISVTVSGPDNQAEGEEYTMTNLSDGTVSFSVVYNGENRTLKAVIGNTVQNESITAVISFRDYANGYYNNNIISDETANVATYLLRIELSPSEGTNLNNYDTDAVLSDVNGDTKYQLKVEKRIVFLTLSAVDDDSITVSDTEEATFITTYNSSSKAALITWAQAENVSPGQGLIEKDVADFSIELSFYDVSNEMVTEPINAVTYEVRNSNYANNPNYDVRIAEASETEGSIVWRLIIQPAVLEVDTTLSTYNRDGADHDGKIYDGQPFSYSTNRIQYNFTGFQGNDENSVSVFNNAFTYAFYSVVDGERIALGSNAPVNAGSYVVDMIWDDSNIAYPAANYRLSVDNGIIEREFTIAKRYLGVSFSGNADQNYDATYKVREITITSLANTPNSGPIGEYEFDFINYAVEITDNGFVYKLIGNGFDGYKDVGTYFFTGCLNPDADPSVYDNANYEIYPEAFEYTNANWESEGYPDIGGGLVDDDGNMLIAPGKLNIHPYTTSINVAEVADKVVLQKEYGTVDGSRLSFVHELIEGEALDMTLTRVTGEDVKSYAITGVVISNEELKNNYNIQINGTLEFEITKRQVAIDINDDMIRVDYDGTIYLRSANDIPSGSTSTRYIYPELTEGNPFYRSTTVTINDTETHIIKFAYIPDVGVNGVSDAGWYNISSAVLLSSDDQSKFELSLIGTSFQKFRIAPQLLSFSLGDVDNDGTGFIRDPNDAGRSVITRIFQYSDYAEPDYYKYMVIPTEDPDQPGVYWGYAPLDNEYSAWLKSDRTQEELDAIFRKYFRIVRANQGSENSHYVGEYQLTITVLDGNGNENHNFEPGSDVEYFLLINRFDLNTVVTKNDWNSIIKLVQKEKTYDGTNYIADFRTGLENLLGTEFTAEFAAYYDLLDLRFTAAYDSDTGYYAGEGKDITISCNFLGASGSTLNANFILPDAKKLAGQGTILKRKLTVSISDYNTPISLTYGESIDYSGEVVTGYTDAIVSAVFEGFIVGENPGNTGIGATLLYKDGSAYDVIKTVGNYTLKVTADYIDGALQNYEISDADSGRAEAFRQVTVQARAITVVASGKVYEKPINGHTDVPNFYVYNGEPQSPTSIFNDYFTVEGLLTGLEDANLRISYSTTMSTGEVSDSAWVMMNRFVLYTGDESQDILNENYTMASNLTVNIPARIRSLGTVSVNGAVNNSITTVYNNQPVSVSYTDQLLEMDGYVVSVELRYSGAAGTGTVYPFDVNDENYENGYSFNAPKNAGDYELGVYLKIAGDETNNDIETFYSYQYTVRLKINKAKPRIMFSAQNLEMTYGDFDPIDNAITAAVYFLASEEVPSEPVSVSYSFVLSDGTLPVNPPVGTHTVTAVFAGNANYEGVSALEANTTLRINPKKITVGISGTDNLVYSGVDLADQIIVTFNGVIEGDSCEPVKRFTNNVSNTSVTQVINAGQYTVRVSPSNTNYEISGPSAENFTVKKRTLTVTANAPGTHYGDTPQFEYSYDGFAEGDTVEDLLKAPTVNLGGIMVGDNAIRPSGGDDPNYEFVYKESILVVLKPEGSDDKPAAKLTNTTTIVLIVLGAVVGIALLIFLSYFIKTMTYRSMYNVEAIKKKVNGEFKRKK